LGPTISGFTRRFLVIEERKPQDILYQILCASFCVIVVVSNILSAKMVTLPWIDMVIPAGLFTYPLTFILSDLATEVYGAKKAKHIVYIALGMNLLSFGMIQASISLPAQNLEEQRVFHAVLGLSGLRIFSSLISYVTSQVIDIQLYALIKRWTGMKHLWLRNNASTCISQIVDTVMIDIIFLWWGLGMSMKVVLPIMLFSYAYKAFFSIACTPLFYTLVYMINGKWQRFTWFFRANQTRDSE
jgi:queuosine precursor transporter